MRTGVYCRVSTDDQEKEGTSLRTQLEACVKYCQDKGYQVVRKFSETYSGLTLDRPKLTELRNMIGANDLDIIVVYCLDRLSRDPAHGAMLFQELEKHHVTLEAVTETIENTDMGKLISYIRGYASKVEAEKIRERTMRGKLAYVREGKLPQGTGIGIYGYNWNKTTGKRTIHEYEAKIVQKIFTMALSGTSFNKIAIELNKQGISTKSGGLWYPLTIRRIVNNPTYTGKTYYGMTKRINNKVVSQPEENWTLLPDITPPIITEEMFKRTQETIAKIKQSRPIKESSPYLLTGFINCAKCGSTIGGTTLSGKYRYYKCRGASPTATRQKICNTGYIKAPNLEKEIWNKVLEMFTSPLTLLSMLTDLGSASRVKAKQGSTTELLEKQITQLRKKIKTYPIKEKRLYELLSSDDVTKDYVLDTVSKIKKDRINDQKQLEQLLANRKESLKAERINIKLSDLSEQIRKETMKSNQAGTEPTDDLENKRGLLESLHLNIVINPETKGYNFSFKLGGQIVSTTEANDEAIFNQALKDFEKQHPDVTIEDMLDLNKQLPGNSPFAQTVNKVKQNLVTIEQTWGCSHALKSKRVFLSSFRNKCHKLSLCYVEYRNVIFKCQIEVAKMCNSSSAIHKDKSLYSCHSYVSTLFPPLRVPHM